MDRVKIFIVTMVITLSAIILFYLLYVANLYDRYTLSQAGSSKTIIYTSGDGNLSDGKKLSNSFNNIKSALKYASINAEFINDNNKIKSYSDDAVKYGKKIVICDINCSKLVINKNTVLLRIPPADEFLNGTSYASKLVNKMNNESIKVNVLNYKKGENPNVNTLLLKIDVSNNCDSKTAEDLISKIIINVLNIE